MCISQGTFSLLHANLPKFYEFELIYCNIWWHNVILFGSFVSRVKVKFCDE